MDNSSFAHPLESRLRLVSKSENQSQLARSSSSVKVRGTTAYALRGMHYLTFYFWPQPMDGENPWKEGLKYV